MHRIRMHGYSEKEKVGIGALLRQLQALVPRVGHRYHVIAGDLEDCTRLIRDPRIGEITLCERAGTQR